MGHYLEKVSDVAYGDLQFVGLHDGSVWGRASRICVRSPLRRGVNKHVIW